MLLYVNKHLHKIVLRNELDYNCGRNTHVCDFRYFFERIMPKQFETNIRISYNRTGSSHYQYYCRFHNNEELVLYNVEDQLGMNSLRGDYWKCSLQNFEVNDKEMLKLFIFLYICYIFLTCYGESDELFFEHTSIRSCDVRLQCPAALYRMLAIVA